MEQGTDYSQETSTVTSGNNTQNTRADWVPIADNCSNTISPASLKAKEVATEEYVDLEIANIDVSGEIDTNNDVFAQKVGARQQVEDDVYK